MRPDPAAIASVWIRQNAVRLEGVGGGAGFEDAWPLASIAEQATIVGLGEATHGTHEFLELKRRLLEFFVAALGFNILMVEANFAESMAVNRYVLNGEGDPRKALANMGWTCDTQEMLEVVEWMRNWNLRNRQRNVRFYGVDMQFPSLAAEHLLTFLDQYDRPTLNRVIDALLPLANGPEADEWVFRSVTDREATRRAVDEAIAGLNEMRGWASSPAELDDLAIARLHAQVLRQAVENLSDPAKTVEIRDQSMAQNVVTLVGLHGTNARAVVWAHNAHVRMSPGHCMGARLRESFGHSYRSIGFAFDRGSFQAVDASRGILTEHTVQHAPASSLDGVLARTGIDVSALDLRDIPAEVGRWFAMRPASRSIGALWDNAAIDVWSRHDPRELFDGIVFVADTTAAKPNSGRSAELSSLSTPNPAFVNLDYRTTIDDRPEGWRVVQRSAGGSSRVTVVKSEEANGLEILRVDALSPVGSSTVSQAIRADDLRGRMVTFRCYACVERVHYGTTAQLVVRVRPILPPGFGAVAANMIHRRYPATRSVIRGTTRCELSVTVDVPEVAAIVELSLMLTGEGRARFGPVETDI